MKKSWSVLLISCFVALSFSSCSNEDNSWRDENLAFFDDIRNREGIHEIGDSLNAYPGILYEVLKEGTGEKPIVGNVVEVSYAGWLYNDTITYDAKHPLDIDEAFDNSDSYDVTINDSSIISGWYNVLQYMPMGSKWRIYIPYYLGYGTSTTKGIPGYSTLIFDIELKRKVSDYYVEE